MPPKFKRMVPPGVSAGVPPPNGGGASESAVNIDHRLKLTADAGVSESIGGAICGGTPVNVSFVETNEATTQISKYIASLSELEQRVCSIAREHLESSFDLSRSSGFVAWKSNK